jgi:conjugative relaxase-like TrwC/TraI family protein
LGTFRGTLWDGGVLMLVVAKITQGAAGGYADYLDGRSQPAELGDYYLKDGERVEAAGRWAAGATAVGCDPAQPVGGETLRALMAVRYPATGEPLRQVGGNGTAVAALDATFSAPKSVSAIWALGESELRERIERAHELAIGRALDHAIEHVPMLRLRVDQQTVVHTKALNVVATSWRHTTARAVDGRPPDPQLHSHVLLHGAVRGDGRVVAIDSRSWLIHRRELGAAYRSELARELTALGFAVERGTGRGGRYFEIQGIPAQLIDRWSSRHHQVRAVIDQRLRDQQTVLEATIAAGGPEAQQAAVRLEQLRRSGQLSPKEDRAVGTHTRDQKRLETRGDLDRHWNQVGREAEFDRRCVEQLRSPRELRQPADSEELLRRLTEFDATFTDREARAVAFEASAGTDIQTSLASLEQLRSTGELLPLVDGRATTREHRAAERRTVMLAERLAGARVTSIPDELVQRQTDALDAQLKRAGGTPAGEQRDAVELACGERQLAVIEGQAGTGKSTALIGVARAHQADGREIIVTSTAALAAERLASELAEAGVKADSYSTAGLHAAIDAERVILGPATTVIHDEAALASTREQHQLFTAIETREARLIEIGDPGQSQAVGAGGLWPDLQRAAEQNDALAVLKRNVRAQDPADRRDQQEFRGGEHERALHGYANRDRVTIHLEQRQAEDAALEAAHADRQAGKRTLVMAQTSNERLDELNARAQAIRLQHGELGRDTLPVTGKPYALRAGDGVQVRRTIRHPNGGQLRNGTSGQVIDVDPAGELLTLRLADQRTVTLDRAQIDRADIRLSYVQHPFPAQGRTSDTAHVIVAEHTTQEGSYVALTRARENTHIHASLEQLDLAVDDDRLAALAEHIGRSEPDLPSIRTPLAYETEIENQHARELNSDPVEESIDLRPAAGIEPSSGNRRHEQTEYPPVPEHVTAVLGPRPRSGDPNLRVWEHAASTIQQYRDKYEIPSDEPVLLGSAPAVGAFQQRYDRRQAAATVLDALDQVDRPGFHRGDMRNRLEGPDLNERELSHQRDLGWEP